MSSEALRGKRIVVTRASEQSGSLASLLRERGAIPVALPTIKIESPDDLTELDRAIGDVARYNWIVFTSVNAVRAVAERMLERGLKFLTLNASSVAAIGRSTARAVSERGVSVTFVPSRSDAETLVQEMTQLPLVATRILLPQAQDARDVVARGLAAAGSDVDRVVAYRTRLNGDQASARATFSDNQVDAVTLTSSSTAKNLLTLLGADAEAILSNIVIASIGPITTQTARELGLAVAVEAAEPTVQALVDALEAATTWRRPETLEADVAIRSDEAVSRARFPVHRPRRLRNRHQLRQLVRETILSVDDFIYPAFVCHGQSVREEIPSMPGVFHLSVDALVDEAKAVAADGIPGILLFGLPKRKDDVGTEAYDEDGIVQRAVRAIKRSCPELLVVTDVCLCEYTSHGHCGVVRDGCVDNDRSLPLIAKTALSHAEAGADLIAPSDMMDGRVGAIRSVLDDGGFSEVPIMAYSAKYASAFYGPFREAADSAPQFGDRRGYQMDPANSREAMDEIALDLSEGADIVMVKPALAYLDVIRQARDRFNAPIAAYNVSGEYSMIKAAAHNGWLDERRAALEVLTSIKRAGADIIISYFARDVARWLREG